MSNRRGRGADRAPSGPPLPRYAVWLEYDGSAFAGWQYQDNAHTVQAALETAIDRRFGERRRVGGASRTDTGVHARGQVAMFELLHAIPVRKLVPALNTALPKSVRVLQAKRVPAGWDPRRQALKKTYAYLVFNRPVASPLLAGRVWTVHPKLNLAAMRRAARLLTGRHDFSSFRASGCEAAHAVRTVERLTLSRRGPLVTIRITADAFLYRMVRNLVGTLVQVGLGKLTAPAAGRILRARDRKCAGPTAPAWGLYLEKIRFRLLPNPAPLRK